MHMRRFSGIGVSSFPCMRIFVIGAEKRRIADEDLRRSKRLHNCIQSENKMILDGNAADMRTDKNRLQCELDLALEREKILIDEKKRILKAYRYSQKVTYPFVDVFLCSSCEHF